MFRGMYRGSGQGGSVDYNRVIEKIAVMPSAETADVGKIYMYTGESDDTYTHGYIYECVSTESGKQWEQLDVQPGGQGGAVESVNGQTGVVVLDAEDVGALPDTTKYAASVSWTIDSSTYIMTLQLKDQDGANIGTAQTIDLPLESVVVSGSYDNVNKKIVLTLKNGSTVDIPVGDLISGLQTEITSVNPLSADLVDDTTATHKFVSTAEKTAWNSKQSAISDLEEIRAGAAAGATAVQPSDLATVATTGDYEDLTNKSQINGVTLSGNKTSADLGIYGNKAIEIANMTTVAGYSVPNPTAEELTAVYNAVVAGNSVQIVDSNDVYYQVLQADSVDDAINVEILFFSEVSLLYTLENDTVSITYKKLGGGANKNVITLTGESGTLTSAQIAQVQDDTAVLEIVCDGDVFRLSNKDSTLTYRTFINTNCEASENVSFKVIYVQLNSEAVNYGHWTLEEVSAGGGSGLPDPTGHAGEFLTTDGTDASWENVYAMEIIDWEA